MYATNTTATWAVLSLAGEQGVRRAVLASSINAFGVPMNPHDVHPAYYPLDEDVPADVADAYSLSKQADEAAARAQVEELCRKFLTNPVIEDADIRLEVTV